jgi:hypothetical protein
MSALPFAYFGPETMLPLTSIAATVIGIFMMFGRHSFRLARRMFRFRAGRPARVGALARPHFAARLRESSTAEAPR